MKSRILSIVLAISMIAVVFAVAAPVRAAVNYTGSVSTWDVDANARTDFVQGEDVYVKVIVKFDGNLSTEAITVALVDPDGNAVTHFHATAANGYYNSTDVGGQHLATGAGFAGNVQAYDVVVTQDGIGGPQFARAGIIVRAQGLFLNPEPALAGVLTPNGVYWPGEMVTWTVVIGPPFSGLVFYVQIINETDVTVKNWTGLSAVNGFKTDSWTVDSAFADGTYAINVRQELGNGVWFSESFEVQEYVFQVSVDRFSYLPGETALISYLAFGVQTGAPDTTVNISYAVSLHLNTQNATTWTNSSGTLPATEHVWNYTVPADIALWSDIDITMWANKTGRTAHEHLTLSIGSIAASVDTDQDSYLPGETVVVQVFASIGMSSLPGATVDIAVSVNGSTPLPDYGATGLVTDQAGQVTHTFRLASGASSGNYIVVATVSKLGFSTHRNAVFDVSPSAFLMVKFDKAYYIGGEQANIQFEAVSNDVLATVATVGYRVEIATGLLVASETTTGTAQVMIPETYSGFMDVTAFTEFNGNIISGFGSTSVHLMDLTLAPNKVDYRPGDTVTFTWSVLSSLTSGTVSWEITDADDVRVANGTSPLASRGSFSYEVPTDPVLVSDTYDANMMVTTPSGAFDSAGTHVHLVADYELKLSIGKSPYTSGEFKPGQKISIKYNVGSYIFSQRSVYRIHLDFEFDPVSMNVFVTEPSGSISYTIPKNAPMGPFGVMGTLYDGATGDTLSDATTQFEVNNRVSGWDLSVGGISLTDLLLLILLIIVILVLVVVPFMKSRNLMGSKPEAAPAPPESKPPPPPSP